MIRNRSLLIFVIVFAIVYAVAYVIAVEKNYALFPIIERSGVWLLD